MIQYVLTLLVIATTGQVQGSAAPPPIRYAGAEMPAGMTMSPPDRAGWQRCMRPLGADGTVNSSLSVRCERVENGAPKDCQLESGRDAPVRHRAAARCLAPLHRFTDAGGQPANGGPVTIPVRLNVTVTHYD